VTNGDFLRTGMAAIVKIPLLSADGDFDTVFGCLPRHLVT
jgi:hypothetical protein